MVATATKGGTLTVYSDRFSMSGMTGKFDDTVATALKKVSGTNGPDSKDETSSGDAANAQPADSMFDVEYTMQTGATRYAPMQPMPGTKITKKTASPMYPTSSVPIAKTKLPIPTILVTITQSRTHSVSSMVNTVRHPSHHHLIACTYMLFFLGCSCSQPVGRHGQIPRQVEGLDVAGSLILFYLGEIGVQVSRAVA